MAAHRCHQGFCRATVTSNETQLCRDSAIRVRSGAFEARRGTLWFLPQLVMRPSSIAPNPVEFREAPPNSTVTLTSQRHAEKLPEVTGTSRWNPGFPAATQERPRESFFNTFSGPIPLPWLENNDGLPLTTCIETWLPWHHVRGSLSSQSYFVRNPTLAPQLEKTYETPQSLGDEGLHFMHSLESNPVSSLQTPEEVWLPLSHSVGSKTYPSDSRGEQSPLLPLETRPDSKVSLECNPEISVESWDEH